MRYTEILEACWKGYRQAGMKKKGDRMVPNCVPVSEQEMEEDLKKWFKEKWVRFGPDGKIRGACARGSESEGKPKCLPQSKAHALGKKGRASAAAKKRREDPNPERRGPARNVATKVREQSVAGGSYPEVLYHGSTQEIKGPLTPRQANDIGGHPGSNKNAIYATNDPNFAIAYSLAERGSDTGTLGWKKDPRLIFFGGRIRRGKDVYIHVLPTRDEQGRPLFTKGGADAEWYSVPGVTEITPIKVITEPVDQYLHLLRKPTPEEQKIFQANKAKAKQGVAEGSGFDQEAGIGIDGKSFKFKIRDLVALADNYPVTKINPQQFSKQIAGRDEDLSQSMARAEKADLQYPIIVIKRQNGQLWIADGTHRAHKAILNKLPSVNAKIIPIKDMAPFDVEQGVAEMDKSQKSQERHGDYPVGAKGTTVKAVPAKKVVKDLARDLDKAFAKEKKVKEQYTDDDDWYDDEDDRLRDGDYVRDRQDGESGEVFRMSGDPSERRVRILDRDGRGWYISPERLVAVDRTDPDIMKYFGKKRVRDMDEAGSPAQQAAIAIAMKKAGKKPKHIDEKQDACYRKVKSRYKVWPSAYASGALVQCRKKGAANWGTGAKKK